MLNLKLIFPTLDMEYDALDYRQEYFDHGEYEINGDGGLDHADSYAGWIEKLTTDSTRDTVNHVPATTFFAVDGDRIVGTLQIRHKLNDFLLRHGGHIGYGVRPTERRMGYAARMLGLALEKCRALGLNRVLITCDNGNIGSTRTIIKNGGVLENETLQPDGKITQRYWIDLYPILPVTAGELPECRDVIRQSFATVADEFGLTEQNAATNGAFIKLERLQSEFERGNMMYAYRVAGKIAGFCALKKVSDEFYELEKLAVLPKYRHNGCGKALIDYAKARVLALGGKKLTIGIIEENTVLKDWYAANGFIHMGTKTYDHLPFTVGYMEWVAEK